MKYNYTLSVLLFLSLCLNETASGQIKFGVKAGVNISRVSFDYSDPESLVSFNAGVLSEIDFNEKFFLRSEVLYAVKGWGFTDGEMNLHYLNIPVLLGYRPVPKLSFLAGPEIGFLLKTVRKPEISGSVASYEKFDYGIALGTAYNITKHFGAEMRYIYGFDTLMKVTLRDTNNNVGETFRDGANRVLQINVFYLLGKKE